MARDQKKKDLYKPLLTTMAQVLPSLTITELWASIGQCPSGDRAAESVQAFLLKFRDHKLNTTSFLLKLFFGHF